MAVTEQARPEARMDRRHARMLIDGVWTGSVSGAVLDVENPAKRRSIGDIPRGEAARQAVPAACS